MIAGRLWWLLRWLGHDAVALLDGGLQAWQAAAGAMTPLLPTLEARAFVARPQDLKVHADYVLERIETPHMRLVDARGPDRFRGENETIDPVGGHIPGAVNRFFRTTCCPTAVSSRLPSCGPSGWLCWLVHRPTWLFTSVAPAFPPA